MEEDILSKYSTPEKVGSPSKQSSEEDILEKYSSKKSEKDFIDVRRFGGYTYQTSPEERSDIRSFPKQVLSAATFGATESDWLINTLAKSQAQELYNDGKISKEDYDTLINYEAKAPEYLKPETRTLTAELVGSAYPITKVISGARNLLGLGMNLAKSFKLIGAAKETAAAGLAGAAYSTAKQAISDDEFDPLHVAEEAAMFAGAHVVIGEGLLRGVPALYNWIKDLKPKQQADMFVSGLWPKDLPENEYKFFQDEVVPSLQKKAQQEFEEASLRAVEDNDSAFNQKMANVKAKHEADIEEIRQRNELSDQTYNEEKKVYDDEVKRLTDEYETNKLEIQKQNERSLLEFQQQNEALDVAKSREDIVQNSVRPENATIDLQGRVTRGGEDLGIRPSATTIETPSLKNRVGNAISSNEMVNTYEGGYALSQVIRASDQAEYSRISRLYDAADRLNAGITQEQPGLVQDLQRIVAEIDAIPSPSGPQNQLRQAIHRILGQAIQLGEEGEIIGYMPINNQVLLDQAKALRFSLSYDFAHANPTGIFKPAIDALEEAAQFSARIAGNEQAYQASQVARNAYRQWAQLYQNDYIRPFRNTSNQDFSKLFKSTKDIDNFVPVDRVLQQTNAGRNLSGAVRRSLIEDRLSKIIENPRKYNPEDLELILRELRPVLRREEEKSIKTAISEARRSTSLFGRKVEAPKSPKLVKEPSAPKLPKAPKKKEAEKIPSRVSIPSKPQVKPSKEMQAASKIMEITPEDARKLTNTPSGLKELKEGLSQSASQKKLYEKIGQLRLRRMLQEGNIKRDFTGSELYRVLNKEDNYHILSELLGEEVAEDLLKSSKDIADKRMTLDILKKYIESISTLKAVKMFGIL